MLFSYGTMATKQIAWTTGSGNIILTYQGQGDGTITVESDDNNGAARSQVITVETLDGTKSVNLTIKQNACPVPVGTVLNYAYIGSYQEVELPAGRYKLQCWGAQGGSNGTNSSYGITAKSGGKGGYSEGVITLAQKTTLRVYVGGQGSSSAGGYNGGGSTSGTAQYSYSNEFGYSKMGGGGGATDIRLSDGALLSRMIVAGGGSGGAMCYKNETIQQTHSDILDNGVMYPDTGPHTVDGVRFYQTFKVFGTFYTGHRYVLSVSGEGINTEGENHCYFASNHGNYYLGQDTGVLTQDYPNVYIVIRSLYKNTPVTWSLTDYYETTETVTSNESQVGYVGGGTIGGGYSSSYQGKQNAAGTGGALGTGANQTTTNYRYCSGGGGGGWYGGGGGQRSDSSMTYCKYSGGGSGFVNTAANAQYRPSGYTGLELDSGTTYAGDTSFPAPSGGNETGHSGNGYVRITRLS